MELKTIEVYVTSYATSSPLINVSLPSDTLIKLGDYVPYWLGNHSALYVLGVNPLTPPQQETLQQVISEVRSIILYSSHILDMDTVKKRIGNALGNRIDKLESLDMIYDGKFKQIKWLDKEELTSYTLYYDDTLLPVKSTQKSIITKVMSPYDDIDAWLNGNNIARQLTQPVIESYTNKLQLLLQTHKDLVYKDFVVYMKKDEPHANPLYFSIFSNNPELTEELMCEYVREYISRNTKLSIDKWKENIPWLYLKLGAFLIGLPNKPMALKAIAEYAYSKISHLPQSRDVPDIIEFSRVLNIHHLITPLLYVPYADNVLAQVDEDTIFTTLRQEEYVDLDLNIIIDGQSLNMQYFPIDKREAD